MNRAAAWLSCAAVIFMSAAGSAQSSAPVKISVDWTDTTQTLRTTPTLQVVVNPPLRRGSPIHNEAFATLKGLGADYVRYVPWLPYPRLAVAELEPPTKEKTSWDFSLIDPMTIDFLKATEGHSTILNFSTSPAWMWESKKQATLPKDPNQVVWDYTQGTKLRDPSRKQLADYYTRLIEWYTKGGFTDELGMRHESGHHFSIPYWEVFNEVDSEHEQTPEEYTKNYDAIVGALHTVDPQMKFVGLALAFPERNPAMFEYFLNHANHRPGIPLDMISYHFYATPTREQTLNDWQYSFFDQAERFIVATRFIESIRKRLSPETRTDMDEIGSILPTDGDANLNPSIPPLYWHASGALYAYLYVESAKMGIDVVGESQLVGYPTQYPSVSMVDWTTGKPNARFEVLRLIHQNVRVGDLMGKTTFEGNELEAQAFRDATSNRLLLINKRNRDVTVTLPEEFAKGQVAIVDLSTDGTSSVAKPWAGRTMTLAPFAVAMVTAAK